MINAGPGGGGQDRGGSLLQRMAVAQPLRTVTRMTWANNVECTPIIITGQLGPRALSLALAVQSRLPSLKRAFASTSFLLPTFKY